MKYFLVQISHYGIYSLLLENQYINNKWRKTGKDQNQVEVGSFFIIYFTTSISMLKQQIKYIYEVTNISNNKSKIVLNLYAEVEPLNINKIIEMVNKRELSYDFKKCSRHGFNICEIIQDDFNVILSYRKNKSINVTEIKNYYKNRFDIVKLQENKKIQLEQESDINLLYMHKNGIYSIRKKDVRRLREKNYIKISNKKIIITEDAEKLITSKN
jgi:hypothetical protein